MGLRQEIDSEALRRTFLDTVVDRNSQAEWPASLITRTETYIEWAAQVPQGVRVPITMLQQRPDITPAFWRKRYLVNTVADSLAFLGYIRGHLYLHEAFQDALLLDLLAPLFVELQHALHAEYGFDLDELWAYKDRAIRRLATPGIDRRIDTVARGAWRKLGVDERFVRPIPKLMALGETPTGLARAIAAVIWVSKNLDESAAIKPGVLAEVREMWSSAPWSEALQALVFEQLQVLANMMDRLKR
jgi:mannitol-1-phosphate/altronate dehydrogenase